MSRAPDTAQVCVVGGGPVGCFAAYHLAQAGIDVMVLEEHPVVGQPVDCSGVIGAEAFETLQLPRDSVTGALQDLELMSPLGSKVRYGATRPLAYLVNRARFDQSLAALAQQAGARLRTGVAVSSLSPEADGVRLGLRTEGAETHCRARAVVLANGPRYRFQDQLGMGRPRRVLQTVQADVPAAYQGPTKVFFGRSVAPGSFAWFLPTGEGRVKFGVSATAAAVPAFHCYVSALIERGLLAGNSVPSRGWLIPIEPLRRTFSERVLAAGDAAGQTKPTTGGGLYYGLLAARIAAETLAEALRAGDLSARRLAGYERRWRAVLGPELRTALFFRTVAEHLTDSELDCLIRLACHERVMRLLRRRIRFDWHRDLIVGLVRRPQVAATFLRAVVRSCLPG